MSNFELIPSVCVAYVMEQYNLFLARVCDLIRNLETICINQLKVIEMRLVHLSSKLATLSKPVLFDLGVTCSD